MTLQLTTSTKVLEDSKMLIFQLLPPKAISEARLSSSRETRGGQPRRERTQRPQGKRSPKLCSEQ
jgi:hypothetical protein